MEIIYRIIVGVTILMLVGCASTNKQNSLIKFENEHFLKHSAYDTELLIKQGQITVIDSFLIVISVQQNPICMVYSIPKNMKELYSYGRIGNGPGEFSQPLLSYSFGNTFGLNELNKKELAIMHLINDNQNISIVESHRLKADTNNEKDKSFRFDYYFTRLNDEHYVSLLYEGESKFFSLFDNSLTLKNRFGESPIPEEVSPMVAMNRFQGRVATFDGTMIYATSNLPYLTCYHFEDGIMEKKWSFFYHKPFYEVKNGDLLLSKEKSFGKMLDLAMDNQFIYLLHFDQLLSEYNYGEVEKSLANVVMVFDHKGNAVTKLNLSFRINRIALSNDGRELYGIAHLPEPTLVEFDLPKVAR